MKLWTQTRLHQTRYFAALNTPTQVCSSYLNIRLLSTYPLSIHLKNQKHHKKRLNIFLFILSGLFICSSATAEPITILQPELLDTAERDDQVFTQGFELHDGYFYESSGLYGKSFVSRFAQNNPATKLSVALPRQYFAEGITLFDGSLFLVTWKGQTGWRLDPQSLQVISSFEYEGEGWGLAHDSQHIIMSNGSDLLKFYSPDTFELIKTLRVTLQGKPLDNINELEVVNNLIWANRWKSDMIYGIDAQSGKVVISVDCSSLRKENKVSKSANFEDVLNGIAYDSERQAFWVTGKRWSHRYLIKLPLSTSTGVDQ